MRRIELLAPAGNFDCLKAAVNNGADAVYLGGKNFSARAFANNFDKDSLKEAIKFAHLRDVKVYVTVNTLLNENELENALNDVKFYYENDVDALLIQDLGLYYRIKQIYPDFELHCSTQMHVHNIEGVKTAKTLGFKRAVIARESNLDFIKEACKQDIEIETFVHGAICVSYSGQCLMSSSTKKRSANKGMCAQCCRLKYTLLDENLNKINTNTDYLLSPKDMFLLNDIPSLIQAGVSSLKIEGRMKSPAYVGYVTSIYRKAIDAYYDNQSFVLSKTELDNLKVLFNREFTNDLLNDRNGLFGQITPNHLGIEIGKTIGYRNNKLLIKLSKPLNQFDGIRINDFGCIVNMLYKDNLLVNSGQIGDIVSINSDTNINGTVYKTLDYQLEQSILSIKDKHIPIDITIDINKNESVKIEYNNFIYDSKVIAEEALKSPLTSDNIIKQFSKLNDSAYELKNIEVNTNDSFLPVSKLNEIRRNFIEELDKYRLSLFKRETIYSEVKYKPLKDDIKQDLIEVDEFINDYHINYVINRNSSYKETDKAVISEFGGLLKEYPHKIAYYTLNCMNSYTYEFIKLLGFENIILSSEINELEVNRLIESFSNRNSIKIYPAIFKKGDRALMYIKTNPFIDYQNAAYISDGNNKYKIKYHQNILELIEDFNNDININEQLLTFTKKS